MSKRRDFEFLSDIEEATERIGIYIDKMDYEEFLQDIKTQDAIVRNLEIIGEAVKNLSSELKENYNDIDWKKIAGMRDRIIHCYFGVNWDIVWRASLKTQSSR
ncbi:MAG: DUF86 domain-containing protein [Candidatus Desantisbacteria bacterium]